MSLNVFVCMHENYPVIPGYVIFEVCFVVVITLCVVHREAESQLSSDTDLEDPDGKNAKTGKGMVGFSNLISSFIHFPYLSVMFNQSHRQA